MPNNTSTSIDAIISAIKAIETELGTLPSGIYADVKARLDVLESRGSGSGGTGGGPGLWTIINLSGLSSYTLTVDDLNHAYLFIVTIGGDGYASTGTPEIIFPSDPIGKIYTIINFALKEGFTAVDGLKFTSPSSPSGTTLDLFETPYLVLYTDTPSSSLFTISFFGTQGLDASLIGGNKVKPGAGPLLDQILTWVSDGSGGYYWAPAAAPTPPTPPAAKTPLYFGVSSFPLGTSASYMPMGGPIVQAVTSCITKQVIPDISTSTIYFFSSTPAVPNVDLICEVIIEGVGAGGTVTFPGNANTYFSTPLTVTAYEGAAITVKITPNGTLTTSPEYFTVLLV